MKLKNLPYLLIIILLIIILLQNRNCSGSEPETVKIDTVFIPRLDSFIVEKPVPLATKPDTVWLQKPENKPDTTYQGLLKQYNFLGNRYFESHYYSKTFPIKDYGTITVEDSVKENKLIFQKVTSDLLIPQITKTKVLPYRQLYLGIEVIGNPKLPVSGVYGSGIFKTKKDQLYGLGVGYDGNLSFKASIHWPLRIK